MPLTRDQVRAIDRRAIEEFGIPGVVLMENAGRGAAELLARLNSLRERVAILCGPGNNGGDGFVMARHLDRLGITVNLFMFCEPEKLSADAAVNYHICERMGLPISQSTAVELTGYGWVVDALFGTGLRGALQSPWSEIVAAINFSEAKVLAVDIPSGLDCDTGEPLGPTVRANHTVTFVGMKEGFLTSTARQFAGEIHFVDIGAPRKLVDEYLKL